MKTERTCHVAGKDTTCDMDTREAKFDARGIFLCYACKKCWNTKRRDYRPDVLTDPNYWADEPIDEE